MENVIQVQNEYRKQQWAQIIRECQGSGLSNKEYCRQQGISEKTYYYWLRELRSEAAEGIPQIGVQILCCLWIYRPAPRDQRAGGDHMPAVWPGVTGRQHISVLREADGPNHAVLHRGRICAAVQAAEQRNLLPCRLTPPFYHSFRRRTRR